MTVPCTNSMECGLRATPALLPLPRQGETSAFSGGLSASRLLWRCGGRGGRFPATPVLPENAVYARWLKAAREALHREPLPRGETCSRDALEAGREVVEAGRAPLGDGQLLVVVSQSAQFGEAFKLEARALGHEALGEPGLWAAPVGAPCPLDVFTQRWQRMAGLRCVVRC